MKAFHRALAQLRQFPVLETLCMPVIVFLLSACQVGEIYAPWGLAAVAGGGRKHGFACAVGAILGAVAFFDFQSGVRYGASAILIYCGTLAFAGSRMEKKSWFRPFLAAGMLLVVQSVYLIGRPFSVALTCLAATACTAVCTAIWGHISLPAEDAAEGNGFLPASGGAAAFHAIYDSFFRGTQTPKPENPSVLFDRAAEQICRDCPLRGTCWQADYTGTYDAFNSACSKILQRGRAQGDDFPIYFSSRCMHFPELVAAINSELYAFLLRGQYHRRLQAVQTMAQQQYAQVGDLLNSVQTASHAPTSPVHFHYQTGYVLRPKDGETVCGDQLAAFRAGRTLYLLLSDGMGSGEPAHAESAMIIRLLRQFLIAGIDPLPALRTLNSALRLRGQTGGGYTTIDLLQLPLQGDKATLFKYGAPCSYYKRGRQVLSLGNQSFPAGLEDDGDLPDTTRFTPEDDSYFIMVTDGILSEGEGWLLTLLQKWNDGNPGALARQILTESAEHGGTADDCGVIVSYIEERHSGEVKSV